MINYIVNNASKSFKYFADNKLISGIAIYFLVSLIIKIIFSIDILIPCLWSLLVDFNCPGCGLTRALIKILNLDLKEAFYINPLIFIIIPTGLFYTYFDFLKYQRKRNLHRKPFCQT